MVYRSTAFLFKLVLSFAWAFGGVTSKAAAAPEKKAASPKTKISKWIGRTVGGQPVVRARHWIQNSPAGSVHVFEKWNKAGALVERTLNYKDRTETSIDRDGDGRLEEWEYFSHSLRVKLSEPEAGHFFLMDVEQERERDIVKMKLRRLPSGEYRSFAQYREPKKVMYLQGTSGLDDDIVAGQCLESEESIQSNAINVNLAIVNLPDAEIQGTISGKIMNESCHKEPFKKNMDEMTAGILAVFRSDKDFVKPTDYTDQNTPDAQARRDARKVDRAKTGNYQGIADHSLYLGCLRRYQLDTHASRIESGLFEYQLSQHYYEWKIACEVKKDPPLSVASAENGKRTGCIHKGIIKGQATKQGKFPEIKFVKHACEQNKSNCDSTPADFAKTFFHEMLHYSGIPDGDLADAITECCSQTKVGTPACTELRWLVNEQKDSQRTWNYILKQAPDSLQKLTDACGEIHGENCTAKANDFVNLYSQQRTLIKKEFDQCASRNDTKAEDRVFCEEKFQVARRDAIDAIFNDAECKLSKRLAGLSEKERVARCGALRAKVHLMLDSGETNAADDFCVKEKRKLGFFCPKTLLLYTPIVAEAGTTGAFCESLSGVTQKVDFSYDAYFSKENRGLSRASERKPADYAVDRETIDATVDAVGIKGPQPTDLKPNALKQKATYVAESTKPTASTGPQRPEYPTQPGKRAEAIAFDLRRQGDFENRVEQYTIAAFGQFIPNARARAAAPVNTDPQFSLPDPLSREVSSLDGPAARRVQAMSSRQSGPGREPAAELEKARKTPAEVKVGPVATAGKPNSLARNGNLPEGTPGARSQGRDSAKSLEDPTAREAFITFLLSIRELEVLRTELARSSTQVLLERHLVAVIDDQGKRHPVDSEAKHWLIFNHERGVLLRMEEKR